jgi:hypothetical protein
MNQYPIWVDVEACIYKTSKSYGAKNTNHEKVLVGTSSKNSHHLCTRSVTRKELSEYRGFTDVLVFRSFHDGLLLKELVLSVKTKEVLESRTAQITPL